MLTEGASVAQNTELGKDLATIPAHTPRGASVPAGEPSLPAARTRQPVYRTSLDTSLVPLGLCETDHKCRLANAFSPPPQASTQGLGGLVDTQHTPSQVSLRNWKRFPHCPPEAAHSNSPLMTHPVPSPSPRLLQSLSRDGGLTRGLTQQNVLRDPRAPINRPWGPAIVNR